MDVRERTVPSDVTRVGTVPRVFSAAVLHRRSLAVQDSSVTWPACAHIRAPQAGTGRESASRSRLYAISANRRSGVALRLCRVEPRLVVGVGTGPIGVRVSNACTRPAAVSGSPPGGVS